MDLPPQQPVVTTGADFSSRCGSQFRAGERTIIPNNAFGYPIPGPQLPTPAMATSKHYFVTDSTWQNILDYGEFDDIVVGSGFCALAYIDKALKENPWRKILVLERGGFWLPTHFQNLPLPFKLLLGGPSVTFPWSLSSKTFESEIKYLNGSCPFFGGRSTVWSAWCPRAIYKGWNMMRGFPEKILHLAEREDFWKEAEELLHVIPASKLSTPIFEGLQTYIDEKLLQGIKNIHHADFAFSAPLAVGRTTTLSELAFEKFSTPGLLLEIQERQGKLAKQHRGSPLLIATDTIVERFELDTEIDGPDHHVNVLHTSRGALCFPRRRTNIILAAGTMPNTTLLMNSTGGSLEGSAGSHLSGHIISHIVARFPYPIQPPRAEHLEIGASYVAGRDPQNDHQYHIQISAVHSPNPASDAVDAARLCPDYAAAVTEEQLIDSEEYMVIVCAGLGELSETNEHSWVRHDKKNPDVTTNVRVQIILTEDDKRLWEIMDTAIYDAIQVMAGEQPVQFWDERTKSWKDDRPPAEEIHIAGVVHETSTLSMTDNLSADTKASVGPDYRPRGCKNVYVTGGALFPSSGSWNPTLTMCGLAQDLAKQLSGNYDESHPVCIP